MSAAKFRASLAVSDRTPRVGQLITVVLHVDGETGSNFKLVTVAPGVAWYDVVGRVTGTSSLVNASIPDDGFGIPIRRTATGRWRASVSFPRPGRWRLVVPVPSSIAVGTGPLVVEMVVVGRH
jgi:hypothetical protein